MMNEKILLYILLIIQFLLMIILKFDLIEFDDISFVIILPSLLIIGYLIKLKKK